MAKLGMPNVIISFREAGIAAIERSQRGIVFLVLEEEQDIIDELTVNTNAIAGEAITGQAITGNAEEKETVENPFVVYTTDDIPAALSENNKDYITKCLLGYVTAPYRVKVYLQATGKTGTDKWQESLKKIAAERWDYLAIPKQSAHGLKRTGKTNIKK